MVGWDYKQHNNLSDMKLSIHESEYADEKETQECKLSNKYTSNISLQTTCGSQLSKHDWENGILLVRYIKIILRFIFK